VPVDAAVLKALGSGSSDAQIAQAVAAGDEIAFEALMRRHNRTLYRVARAILRDDAEAEDVLQLAYLRAYQGIAGFRGQSKLSTWLTRIVANEALMRARQRGRESSVITLGGMGSEEGDPNPEQPGPAEERPDALAMRAQTRALIERRIDLLPEVFRTVFILRALEELSVEETAACLDITEATVRTRFFRARGLLRESLAREIDIATSEAFSFDGERCDRIVSGVFDRIHPPDTR
jgi:RNA polymerase sigma-70 factor (ECF subfamily)